jgi:hypothetical protein
MTPQPDNYHGLKYWPIPHEPSAENTKIYSYLMQFLNFELFATTMTRIRVSLEKGPGLN